MEGLIRELNGLKDSIEQVRAIEVEVDVGRTPNSCDLVLDSLFDNMEDVKTYSTHPAHVKILEMVGKLCESRMKIDYQIKNVGL